MTNPRAGRWSAVVLAAILPGAVAAPAGAAPEPPPYSYYVYVCAESDDEVSVVRYGPGGVEVVKTVTVGSYPTETEGPHGITVSPDGRHWYVSIAHGFPFGSVHKYETGTDLWVGDVTLGLFPATLAVSPATGLLYVVNFNLHGAMEPSTISAVEAETMIEVARIPTGVMPHGSRFNRVGTRHYSVNMMDFELVEVDALGFAVRRRLPLGAGVQPTWVTAPTAEDKVYVTGNNVARIFEVDLATWTVGRTFETGAGPYNLAVTPDGSTLVATYKGGAAVGFWDLATGAERARVATTRTIPHGVAITPDGRYAFVTLEGVGSEPGTVEVYHVPTAERVGAADIGKQAGGIAFWTMHD
ncbi:MAG: YncE family protein [Acidobacteria bacterium]|nr:YncE family protein [Acidobacteriota bacterium]